MARNATSHNIYSGNKSKMVFQNPDDNLDKFDNADEVEEDQNDYKSKSSSNSNSGAGPASGIMNLLTQLCVQIMKKTAKLIKSMLKPKSGQGSGQDSDY
jgi:hypothetical protein